MAHPRLWRINQGALFLSTGLTLNEQARLHAVWMLSALVAIAGCSSSDDAGVATPPPVQAPSPPPPPPPPPPTTYRSVAVNRPLSGQFAINVIDHQRPLPLVQRIDFGTTLPTFSVTSAVRYDTANRTAMLVGRPWLVYAQGGRVFQVPLRTDQAAVPTPVSSLADACRLDRVFELDAGGRDAWALVETAGADGLCSGGQNDNSMAFVRVGDSPSASAAPLPHAVSIAGTIVDAEGRLQWMLAQDGSVNPVFPNTRMPAFGPALNRIDVADIFNVRSLALPSFGPLAEGVFVVVNDTVRLLAGDANALRMSAPLRSLTAVPSASFPFIEAKPYLYAVDGNEVLRITRAGASESMGRLDANDGATANIVDQTSTHLLVMQRNAQGDQTLSAAPKAGGMPRVVLRSTAAAPSEALLLSADLLLYRDRATAVRGDIRRVDIASGADTLVLADTAGRGVVRAASGSIDAPGGQYSGTALLTCQTTVATGDCRGGRLLQIDPRSGSTIVLGTFGDSTVNGPWSILSATATDGMRDGVAVVNAVGTAPASRVTDVYTFEPGQAGSLVRVTTAVP